MTRKTNFKKLVLATHVSSLCWITVGLTYSTLQHLFIDHTYLFDTGYWIGLSSGINLLLMEPTSINPGYSYFNTHFSPIFIVLQWAREMLPWLPTSIYYALWFCLLGLMPIWTASWLTISRLRRNEGGPGRLSAIISSFNIAALWAYVGSKVWIQSFIKYPHTEIIGIQLIGLGWLFLFTPKADRSIHGKECGKAALITDLLGTLFIIAGSLFHELIAGFGCLALASILIQRQINSSHTSRISAAIISLSLGLILCAVAIWLALKHIGYFPGDHLSESALSRIYLGNPPLNHINFVQYWRNLVAILTSNAVAVIFLSASICASLAFKDLSAVLILFAITGYVITSPLAFSPSASTLSDHYGYPLAITYFIFLGLQINLTTNKRSIRYKTKQSEAGYRYPDVGNGIPKTLMTAFTIFSMIATASMIDSFNKAISILLPLKYRINGTEIILKDINLWELTKNPRLLSDLLGHSWNFSHIAEDTRKIWPNINENTIVMIDHRLAALEPNKHDYCNLIAPFRLAPGDTCMIYLKKNKRKSLKYVNLHLKPDLHEEFTKKFLRDNSLLFARKVPISTLNGLTIYMSIYEESESGPKER